MGKTLSVAASSYLMEIISPSNKPCQRLRIKYIPYGDIFFSCGFGFTYEDYNIIFKNWSFFFHSTDPSRMLKVHLAWINICEHACCKTKLWDHIQVKSTYCNMFRKRYFRDSYYVKIFVSFRGVKLIIDRTRCACKPIVSTTNLLFCLKNSMSP